MPANARTWKTSTLLRPLSLSLLVALFGALLLILPLGQSWEEELGLALLFEQRGPRAAPAEVAVIPIEHQAAVALGQVNDPARWPRRLHARIIEQLHAAGAAAIAFDIHFKEPRDPAEDAALSRALREAGNVTLFAYLERETLRLDEAGAQLAGIERLIPPAPEFAAAAARIAPFALPKVPVRVSRFWTRQPAAGDLPTLPLAMLEQYSLPALRAALAAAPDTNNAALATRLAREPAAVFEQLRAAPDRFDALQARAPDPAARRQIAALGAAYRNAPHPFLNFYGPPRSITTLAYDQVLKAEPGALAAQLKGKAVFIGFAEERQPAQRDGFYTVFSQADGLDLSGVEIAATAFANLLHRDTLRAPATLGMLLLVLGYGFVITYLCRRLPALLALAAGLALAGGYYAAAAQLFNTQNTWLPLIIPLLIQTPLALFLGLFGHYWQSHEARRHLRATFGHYLPEPVIDRLLEHRDGVHAPGEHAFGVCLATDAASYTGLAETLPPAELSALMNEYYQTLFAPVRARQGIISDVVGDAMLAIWPAPRAETAPRAQALAAALELRTAAAHFCRRPGRPALSTRIGLHCGGLVLGNVGALDHFEYRAVGDIVNTANRIQSLNKTLGTTLLVSAETLEGVSGFASRRLGPFLLAGKQQSVVIHELIDRTGELSAHQQQLIERFAQALDHFEQGRWPEARAAFAGLRADFPEDGPSRYFAERCAHFIAQPPAHWQGVLNLDHK